MEDCTCNRMLGRTLPVPTLAMICIQFVGCDLRIYPTSKVGHLINWKKKMEKDNSFGFSYIDIYAFTKSGIRPSITNYTATEGQV
jgi:hypothetical protein